MGYEPLHHKYRPQTFAQLVGQDAIAQTLSHALEQQRIAPAYLFCGPRGTGKTSSARILAKSLNCLNHDVPDPHPCGVCEVCRGINDGSILDIVEIDAASNTGVDNIRELIERAQFAPVQCRYKVYAIDECHMLSTAAFNALLKTLEEPPDQVIFVLATTDPQRVLPTIISRCQRFDFRRIPLEAMVSHLQAIAQTESIDITEEAVRLVAQIAQGGLRDAESLLDQLSLLEPPIIPEKVWELVGAVPERDLLELVAAIASDNGVQVLDTVRRLMDRGREPMIVLQNLASFYRDLIIAKTAAERADLVPVTPPTWEAMKAFSQSVSLPLLLVGQKTLREAEPQLRNTTQPRLWLEVTLMNLLPSAQTSLMGNAATAPQPLPRSVNSPVVTRSSAPQAPLSQPSSPAKTAAQPTPEPPPPTPPAEEAATSQPPEPEPVEPPETVSPELAPVEPSIAPTADLAAIWAQVISQMRPMGTRAMMQQQGHLISYDGTSARIGIKSKPLFKMAKGRVANIEAAFEQISNQKVTVTLEVAEAPPGSNTTAVADASAQPPPATTKKPPPPKPKTQNPDLPSPPPPPKSSDPSAPESGIEPPQNTWQPQSDIDRAAKSFADFFNGQIVNLDDDDDDSDTQGKSSKGQQPKPKPPSSPGSDVPF
ncbi:DNA polymerase III subunit gamma/tau [Oscillatoria sp. CS-180]|uniref:DNA polymerase III subunit gamma/tau n=1 Tax=Oscillatoria sp. CS-180 TaxID=3021720 RepID=UPI00232B2CFF|nr:DNA polymerase III subunit gamma/tau [Oscillatoria sp. CS-180]MDB9529417.1 DNA polymerase III subunit gamma/tau [Oscillatoria sp. CS-180]